jgi:hypothetical protein
MLKSLRNQSLSIMKKFLPTLSLTIGLIAASQAQERADVTNLLERYEAIGHSGQAISHYFSSEEWQALRSHLASSKNTGREYRPGGGEATLYGINHAIRSFGSFSTANPATFNTIGNDSGTSDFESSGDIDPFDLGTAYVLTIDNGEFYSIDIASGQYTSLGIIAPPNGEQWNGLEFDPSSGTLYAISSNFVTNSTLSTIDIDNLSYTAIGLTGITGAIAIAIDNNGNMYSYGVNEDMFYTVNKNTGVATVVGPIGFNANFGQDLEWDAASETMFMTSVDFNVLDAELRTVNLQTGATTLVGNIDNGQTNSQVPWSAIQKEGTLSISDREKIQFTVHPNPVEDTFSIATSLAIETLELYNMLGEKVMAVQPRGKNLIDISHLPSGTYLATVHTDAATITKLLIKR